MASLGGPVRRSAGSGEEEGGPLTAGDEEAVTPEPAPAPGVADEAPARAAPVEVRRLVISISQTSDEARDIACLHKLMGILKDFPGQDEVKLSVSNGEKVANLKFAGTHTSYCPELHRRLAELVGEEGLRVESFVP